MRYYSPSGKVSFWLIPASVWSLLLLSPLLGLAYALCIKYLPVYLNFIPTVTAAYFVGLMGEYALVRPGKLRNRSLGIVLGFLMAWVTWYVHWAVCLGGSLANILALLQTPSGLLGKALELAQTGTWSLFDTQVSGWPLYIVWLSEGIVFALAQLLSIPAATAKPFSEKNNAWCKLKKCGPYAYIEDVSSLTKALSKNESAALSTIIHKQGSEFNHSIFYLYYSVPDEYYLSIGNRKLRSENTYDEETLIEYAVISPELAGMVRGSDQ